MITLGFRLPGTSGRHTAVAAAASPPGPGRDPAGAPSPLFPSGAVPTLSALLQARASLSLSVKKMRGGWRRGRGEEVVSTAPLRGFSRRQIFSPTGHEPQPPKALRSGISKVDFLRFVGETWPKVDKWLQERPKSAQACKAIDKQAFPRIWLQ